MLTKATNEINLMKEAKKSQAAFEFLGTYVWAFIVIAITLGVLYYFDVFNFSKYAPQKCTFTSQFQCLDFGLSPTQVKFKLANNLGEDVCVKSVKITKDDVSFISCSATSDPQVSCPASEIGWKQQSDSDFTCTGVSYISSERVELKATMDYYSPNTIPTLPTHTINGRINGRVVT